MIATQVRQKDSWFYLVSFPSRDLLEHVRFVSRYELGGERIPAEAVEPRDDVAAFVRQVERRDGAFQRELVRRKVEQIRNFYETATSQPPIPASVLLYTPERLKFDPLGHGIETVGHLELPQDKFLIIDGQHRLAALHFYIRESSPEAETIQVPCTIFDGHAEDFATEMFVIINSTPTRINKSHLVDLYEQVSWTTPDRKLAAKICQLLYSQAESPLQYKINRLGGRSAQTKWILQAELFNEIHRWIQEDAKKGWAVPETARGLESEANRRFSLLVDFLSAAADVWRETWGNDRYMIMKPVGLKAMLRVAAAFSTDDGEPDAGRFERWRRRLSPWEKLKSEFRVEGFYERFPAKGQVERVARIQRYLLRSLQRKELTTHGE